MTETCSRDPLLAHTLAVLLADVSHRLWQHDTVRLLSVSVPKLHMGIPEGADPATLMRTLRLISHAGLQKSSLIDEATGQPVPDVLRIEFAPLELNDVRWFATIRIHRRGPDGHFLYEPDATPIMDKEAVSLVVGSVWQL